MIYMLHEGDIYYPLVGSGDCIATFDAEDDDAALAVAGRLVGMLKAYEWAQLEQIQTEAVPRVVRFWSVE